MTRQLTVEEVVCVVRRQIPEVAPAEVMTVIQEFVSPPYTLSDVFHLCHYIEDALIRKEVI